MAAEFFLVYLKECKDGQERMQIYYQHKTNQNGICIDGQISKMKMIALFRRQMTI